MKKYDVAIIACIFTFGSATATAQARLSGELRAGVAVPTGDFGNTDLDTGFGFGITVSYVFAPPIGAYVGWDWHKFGSDDADVEQTGYRFGLEFSPEIPDASISIRLRAGLTYEQIALENDIGDIVYDSKNGVGFEIGAVLPFALKGQWSIAPGIRYRLLSQEIEVGGTSRDVDLNYITLDLGVRRKF